jgi:hypothetical protein
MKSLFNEDIPDTPARRHKTGHAAKPGTGPTGKTCRTCKHRYRRRASKVYQKCGLMRHVWTSGPGSDIRASDSACSYWEPLPPCVDKTEDVPR